MQIAQGVTASDWKRLNLNDPDDWERAVSIFEKRIRDRFANAIDFLLADDEPRSPYERRWGFAILALDCLLLETLEAFREAGTDTSGQSKRLCVAFLTTRPAFKPFFPHVDLAIRFYKEFRCGISHNAQVFGDGRVWSIGPLLTLDAQRITINRTAFHTALMHEFGSYAAALRANADVSLRQTFVQKMNFIAAC